MRRHKPVDEQVVVITGASSGIGLATAKRFARMGAKVVLASRNEEALKACVAEIDSDGGLCTYVVADVGDEAEVDAIADHARRTFGGFDTWVNNAGVSIYGKLVDTPMDEKRKLFETNFWGVVYGCRAAVRHLWDKGGVIVNLGSVLSEQAIPIQGIYSASKQAVKAYSDALRMELKLDGAPIDITLIKPAAIDSLYAEHARSHLDEGKPALPPPLYAPEVVAKAIVACAEHPRREVLVGGSGLMFASMRRFFPGLAEKIINATQVSVQSKEGVQTDDALFSPAAHEGEVRGHNRRFVAKRSLFTEARMRPAISIGLAAIAAAAAYKWFSRSEQKWSGTMIPDEPPRRVVHTQARAPVPDRTFVPPPPPLYPAEPRTLH